MLLMGHVADVRLFTQTAHVLHLLRGALDNHSDLQAMLLRLAGRPGVTAPALNWGVRNHVAVIEKQSALWALLHAL